MISNAIRPIQIGQVSSEQQLAAEADVVVLRIVVAFFTIGLRIETEVFRYLPVTIDAVIEARAIDVSRMHDGLGTIDTRIGNRLITAEEFMLDAAQQTDLEVTTIQIVNRSIVELLAQHNTGTTRQEICITLRNSQSGRSRVILSLDILNWYGHVRRGVSPPPYVS